VRKVYFGGSSSRVILPRRWRGIAVSISLVGGAAILDQSPALSQVSGTVQTSGSVPVADAEVLIWGSGLLLDRRLTNSDGRFLSEVSRDSIRRISVHHLGFTTVTISGPVDSSGRVSAVLQALPAPLPEIEVVARDLCAGEPNARARELWSNARRRYAQDTGKRGGLAGGRQERGYVQPARIGTMRGVPTTPRMTRWRGEVDENGLARRLEQEGYAWRRRPGSSLGSRYGWWAYPEFDARHGYHFATSGFGDRHDFYLVGEDEQGFEIAFCPRGRGSSGLRGRILISDDSRFTLARWSVRAANPDELAGGEIVFGEVLDAEGSAHLVAARGVFWREVGEDHPRERRYYQEMRLNTDWIISQGAEWPDCRPKWCSAR
jgi:hypothetical protein